MKKPITKNVNLVEIDWIDSTQNVQVWHNLDDIIKEETESKEVMKSVGYLIHKDKRKHLLANSLHYDNTGKLANRVGSIFTIPTGCVIKIKYL
jgi:hypothetical protein